MIFEDNSQDKHNLSFIKNVINFYGDQSLILNSLQKIKQCTLCDMKRKMIDKYIKEYLLHLNQYTKNEESQSVPEHYKLSSAYARESYNKVLQEEKYLQNLLSILTID
ncbi:hypothetical protein IQ37_17880 [Chryseobacterium piperi]|uniref:Uncharacterized protein n=1 Tax=Chryseobacterium piperi TaxID=558152 RepID=A0A086AHN3_9FLAO|nr:hypothetical protein CJF12_06000 [Chryseobacterium piperi]KFF16197.1 hypothetical protein IQ37_17880 [Chryseobacterium piperi]